MDVGTKISLIPFPKSHLFTYNLIFFCLRVRHVADIFNSFFMFFKITLQYSMHCKKLNRKTVKLFQICIYNLSCIKSRVVQVNVGMSEIGISVHLCGLPCPENTGKTTAKVMQNISHFISQIEWFLVSFIAVRAGAKPVGKFCKVQLQSAFIYLQSNTKLLALCIISLLQSVYSALINRKCLNHMAHAVHQHRV